MNESRPRSDADRLPTLTEVLEYGPHDEGALRLPHGQAEVAPVVPAFDDAAHMQRVLDDVMVRIDVLFECRLREAVARATDGLVRDARAGFTPELREILADALAKSPASSPAIAPELQAKPPLGA